MLLTEWNTEDTIAVAREEGLEEGLEKGEKTAKIEIARNFLADGFPHEIIQKNTGLTLDEIEKLGNQK